MAIMDNLNGNIEALKHNLSSPYNFKGSTTFAALPASGNSVNDTYYCTDKKCNYSWNGSEWKQSSMSETEYQADLIALEENFNNEIGSLYSEIANGNVGNKTIIPNKTTFMSQDINDFKIETSQDGYTYDGSGKKVANEIYFNSDFIPFENTKYLYCENMSTTNVIVFNANKGYVRRNGWGTKEIAHNEGDAFIIVTAKIEHKESVVISDSDSYSSDIVLSEDFTKAIVDLKGKKYGNKPIVCFVDDDGKTDFLTKVKPIFDNHNIKCGIGCISERVGTEGYMTFEQLAELQAKGFEMMSHSTTHSSGLYKSENDLYINSYTDYENDMYNSYVKLSKNGLLVDKFVFPFGWYDANNYENFMSNHCKKWYQYGFNVFDGNINKESVNRFMIDRTFIRDSKGISYYESLFNNVVNNNGLLVIGTHSGESELTSEFLTQVLELLSTKDIEIMTVSDALSYKEQIGGIFR